MNESFIKNKDYIQGTNQEDLLLPFFRIFFNDLSIKKQVNPFSVMDFKGDKLLIELKTRNNALNKYDTTMVGYNKFLGCSKLNKDIRCFFFFKFTDCLSYYEYDNSNFFTICDGGRSDRGIDESSKYVYIPISKLILVK
jgi:hypothetical protein